MSASDSTYPNLYRGRPIPIQYDDSFGIGRYLNRGFGLLWRPGKSYQGNCGSFLPKAWLCGSSTGRLGSQAGIVKGSIVAALW